MKLCSACNTFLLFSWVGVSQAFMVSSPCTPAVARKTSSHHELWGSIYAPDGKDNDEEGVDRDHLGMKFSKQRVVSWAASKDDAAAASDDGDDGDSAETEVVSKKKMVKVTFVNFDGPSSKRSLDVEEGTNILKVAREKVNVRIPYNCRTGLCGSCTADVKDPTWEEGDRAGYQTVRTCQAGAMIPAGCDEMTIDCYRMSESSNVAIEAAAADGADNTVSSFSPMSNFEEGWEDEFAPDYKSGGDVTVARKITPEYTVRQGRRSAIEIEKPHWTPRVDSNIAPWETLW